MSEDLDEDLDEDIPQEEIDGIINELVVGEEGYLMESQTLDIQKLKEQGIVSISSFLEGSEDSFYDNDFNQSNPDYIKGYKYGKTGKF